MRLRRLRVATVLCLSSLALLCFLQLTSRGRLGARTLVQTWKESVRSADKEFTSPREMNTDWITSGPMFTSGNEETSVDPQQKWPHHQKTPPTSEGQQQQTKEPVQQEAAAAAAAAPTRLALRLTTQEVGQRFQDRLQRLEAGCRSHGDSPMFRRMPGRRGQLEGPYWPAMNTTLRFCGIEKTASTTWKLFFSFLAREMKNRSVHEGSHSAEERESHKKTKVSLLNRKPEEASELAKAREQIRSDVYRNGDYVNNTLSFLFVREPYGRLLSAYVDKLFSPNTLFWAYIGKYVISQFRHNATDTSLRCGHDVTFPELVKYFIHSQETGQHRDGHFVPTHDHCNMCRDSFQYIGHLETISQDMPYIINASQSPVNYTDNFSITSIKDNTGWVLKIMTDNILKCMSREEAALRLWKKFQIRGLISKTEAFPLSPEQAQNVTYQQFVELAEAAHNRSVQTFSREQLRRQKGEALREAFASVPLEDRHKLRELLFLDFLLFGFNPDLPDVFYSTSSTSDSYSYFDLSAVNILQPNATQ